MSTERPPVELLKLLDVDFESKPKPKLLVQNDSFKVMRLALSAGQHVPEHKAPKEITVQCVVGHVDFSTGGETHGLSEGRMLHLGPGEFHSVTAVQNSIVLVTMAK